MIIVSVLNPWLHRPMSTGDTPTTSGVTLHSGVIEDERLRDMAAAMAAGFDRDETLARLHNIMHSGGEMHVDCTKSGRSCARNGGRCGII